MTSKPTYAARMPRFAAAVMGITLALAACGGGGPPKPTSGGTAAGSPVRGGTLTFARSADIFTFDPYNTQDDYSIFTELQIYERLVKLSQDGKSVEPELATDWQISDDGLTATFTLRPGVKFSDGTPLAAEDVAFSLTRAIDQKGSWGFLFSPVKSATVVDASHVQLKMSEAFAPLLPALSTFAASIYSKANFEKFGDEAGQHPLGTGAFALERWDKGNELVLTRNPNYWQPGKPYLDKVLFRVVGDDNARVLQLQSGAAQVIDFVPPSQVEQLKSSGLKVNSVLGSAVGWITINEAKKPLDDPNVRCALAYAVDRETIAKTVYFGLATPAKSVVPSGTFYYDSNAGPITFNLDKAKELLSQSSAPNGFNVEIMIPSGDSARLSIAQIWAANLAKIGVRAKINQVEATTGQDLYNTEKYEIWISTWTNDTPDPDEFMGVGLDYVPQNSLHTGFKDEGIRQLVLQARSELDDQKREQLYSQIQQQVNEKCPFVYTVEVPRLYATGVNVQGFAPNTQGKYAFENVWIQR